MTEDRKAELVSEIAKSEQLEAIISNWLDLMELMAAMLLYDPQIPLSLGIRMGRLVEASGKLVAHLPNSGSAPIHDAMRAAGGYKQ